MSAFQATFEQFRRDFAEQRSFIVPSLSVNTNGVTELKTEARNLIGHQYDICRIAYIFESGRGFTIPEIVFPLKGAKPVAIAASLRLFARPNHKDRFTHLIHFLVKNPEVFAQTTYFSLVQTEKFEPGSTFEMREDDRCFFCFSTFPSAFLFFLTMSDCLNGIKYIESLFKLHFHLHGFVFEPVHRFLKDLVFSFFFASNPGRFFENAFEPLIPSARDFTEDREFHYSGQPVSRRGYWFQIALFTRKMVERMQSCACLLSDNARILIAKLKELAPNFANLKYIAVIESCICRYLDKYVDCPFSEVNRSVSKVLLCACPMNHLLKDVISPVLEQVPINVDGLIEALATNREMSSDINDAIDMAGRCTIITSRDLSLLFKMVDRINEFLPATQTKAFQGALAGIMAPKVINDTDLISLRVWLCDSSLDDISLENTQPYDEILDLMDTIDIAKMNYKSEQELRQLIIDNCELFTTPFIEQKLSVSTLEDTSQALANVRSNLHTLQQLSQRIFAALFATENERDRSLEQLKNLATIHAKANIMPALVEHHSHELIFTHNDIFEPCECYDRLIKAVNHHIGELDVASYCVPILQKCFFLDFIDQIDIAFDFQSKVKTNKLPAQFSSFCQRGKDHFQSLSKQRKQAMSRAANAFQWVKRTNRVGYNLNIVFKALRMASMFPDDSLPLVLAISGNPDIVCFLYFAAKYFSDKRIADVIMTPVEQDLISKMRKAVHEIVNS